MSNLPIADPIATEPLPTGPLSTGPLSTGPLPLLIQQQILAMPDRRITFAAFMEQALYHPDWGYYSQRARSIGAAGDFFTAPHLGAAFGEMLAGQLVQMWVVLDRPRPYTLVEMGAGQGLLAKDILRWIRQHDPQCFDCLEYIIVEKTAGLVAEQQQQLLGELGAAVPIAWKTLDAIAAQPIVGCCFSNELVDAFPVHQVVFVQGELQEVYVTVEGDQWVEVLAPPSTPELVAYFAQLGQRPVGPDYPDPYRTEVNLAAIDWLRSVNAALTRGYVLTIDYGYPADRYYSRVRSQGTLQCYYQHSHHSDPYIHIGEQDITAHVNFTALGQTGQAIGLDTVGVTSQAMFLLSLGLGDRIAALGQSDSTDPQEIIQRLRQRDALHQLINPMGLGNFGVLIQSKGLSRSQSAIALTGLATPIDWVG
jgi:SAM-dependent MidA family methyltransferase